MSGGLDRRLWAISSVVILGAVMSILDTTIVNVAIDALARDLNASLGTIQWVSTGYMLALATVIPLTGWAAERFGTKRLFSDRRQPVRRRLRPVRLRLVVREPDHLPRAPGPRRRHGDARPA